MGKIIGALALVAAAGVVFIPPVTWAQMMTEYACGPESHGFQYGPQHQQQNPLGKEEAKQEVESYLKSTGNPDLKLGKITDKGSSFEAELLAKNDSLLDKFLVNKSTGCMRSEF